MLSVARSLLLIVLLTGCAAMPKQPVWLGTWLLKMPPTFVPDEIGIDVVNVTFTSQTVPV